MKKYLSVILAAVLLIALSVPAYAADSPTQKEEVVYGILNTDGSVDHVYVVNRFESGTITDYGDYTEVRNLTTADPLTVNGDEITAGTGADQLYYQGTLQSKDLPWNIAVTYLLDGKEVSAQDLGGKSGALQIKISVTQNETVDASFYNDYALQIALTLDTGLCSDIQADGATVADAGADKQINYTVLPGSGGDFSVTADVRDFEMDAISINGIRLVLALDGGAITDQISQLTSAVRQLDDGAGSLLDGAKQLSAGMQSYLNGLKAFRDGLSQLSGLNTGAVSLRDGLASLAQQNVGLVSGALAIQQSTFDAVNAQVSSMGLPTLTPENYAAVLANIPELAAVKAQLDGAVQFTQGLKSYTGGVAQLGSGASSLADGTAALSSLPASANQLYQAGAQMNTAIGQLRDGLADYKKGTAALRSGTAGVGSDVGGQISGLLDSISGGGEKVVSFVSDKDTNVSSVQFVLKTGAIEAPKTESGTAAPSAQLTFWQKLLQLFGWSKD